MGLQVSRIVGHEDDVFFSKPLDYFIWNEKHKYCNTNVLHAELEERKDRIIHRLVVMQLHWGTRTCTFIETKLRNKSSVKKRVIVKRSSNANYHGCIQMIWLPHIGWKHPSSIDIYSECPQGTLIARTEATTKSIWCDVVKVDAPTKLACIKELLKIPLQGNSGHWQTECKERLKWNQMEQQVAFDFSLYRNVWESCKPYLDLIPDQWQLQPETEFENMSFDHIQHVHFEKYTYTIRASIIPKFKTIQITYQNEFGYTDFLYQSEFDAFDAATFCSIFQNPTLAIAHSNCSSNRSNNESG